MLNRPYVCLRLSKLLLHRRRNLTLEHEDSERHNLRVYFPHVMIEVVCNWDCEWERHLWT